MAKFKTTSEKKSRTREEIVDEWVQQAAEEHRKERKKRRFEEPKGGVTINSLMDAMFIILVFLLMNYAVDPLRIEQSEDLKLPASCTELDPKASVSVTISAVGIVVNDKTIVRVENGKVDKTAKSGSDESMQIQPLYEVLNSEVSSKKDLLARTGGQFDGLLTLVVHSETPFRLMTEVLYTAGVAQFSKYKFAVMQKGLRGNAG